VRGHLRATGGYIGDYSMTHVFEKIGNLNIPTFILSGDKDNWIDLECGREINNLITNSKIVEFEGVSHWAFLQEPEIYTEKIIDFLVSA
jgi:pimeloyl-ACP methyl ester carboxylesterase